MKKTDESNNFTDIGIFSLITIFFLNVVVTIKTLLDYEWFILLGIFIFIIVQSFVFLFVGDTINDLKKSDLKFPNFLNYNSKQNKSNINEELDKCVVINEISFLYATKKINFEFAKQLCRLIKYDVRLSATIPQKLLFKSYDEIFEEEMKNTKV